MKISPLLAVLLCSSALATDRVDFQREIRPLLADRCFACHGRDAEHRQGGLRLDERDAALKGGESGEHAIVPGKADQSELVRRILSTDADLRMPPADSKKTLSASEKELLRRWVAEGAEYKAHWAFAAPVRPSVPTVQNAAWPKNDIDRFILTRLEKEGLAPSPPADAATLSRRRALDITGLPPDDKTISIQQLLASPHYGERWGRIWLDGARYADSDGYEKDKPRFVWAYRDWVVGALNRDLPYKIGRAHV